MKKWLLLFLIFFTGVLYAEVNETVPDVVDTLTPQLRPKRANGDYDYYYSAEEEEEATPRYLLFSIIMALSIVFILVEILVTLYGYNMPDHPLRWHTLNYSCWNCFQLIIFANCADESSFHTFLNNDYISEHCDEIQRTTMAVYSHSMFFVTPAVIVQYFVPSSKRWPIMKYYFWIPIMFSLDIALFLSYSSQPWAWLITDVIPVDAYSAGVTGISFLFLAILSISGLCAIFQYLYYYCQYCARPEGQTLKKLYSLINYILFIVYYILITVFHSPYNSVCSVMFLTPYVMEWVLANLTVLAPLMDFALNSLNTLMSVQQFFALLVPTIQFFATFICLKIYRNQLFGCCSCGQSRHLPYLVGESRLPHGCPEYPEKVALEK